MGKEKTQRKIRIEATCILTKVFLENSFFFGKLSLYLNNSEITNMTELVMIEFIQKKFCFGTSLLSARLSCIY